MSETTIKGGHLTERPKILAEPSIVTDATGLTAKYDFTVTYAAADPLPDVFAAVESQLGLKLQAEKVPVEVFVVDHMEMTLQRTNHADKPSESCPAAKHQSYPANHSSAWNSPNP
ncbi:hypothetical protein SBA4_1100009 [Candidatus Sulfopaludibacter sp. SbA4]|nr:hypothetical protein SBA4_1100009 [Candidatus Sulfopaludibacter sp. SbA4]